MDTADSTSFIQPFCPLQFRQAQSYSNGAYKTEPLVQGLRRRQKNTSKRSICTLATSSISDDNTKSREDNSLNLSKDELAVSESAITATNELFRISRGKAALKVEEEMEISTADLLAYCSVKGVNLNGTNIWNRDALMKKAKEYYDNEKLTRTYNDNSNENESTAKWNDMSDREKVRLLHHVCNAEGDVTYIDPATGYTVFSAFAHLKRGNCCGVHKKDDLIKQNVPNLDSLKEVEREGEIFVRSHRCRHCPYTDNGYIGGNLMKALKERIPVIEYVRQGFQNQWKKGQKHSTSTFSFSTSSSTSSSSPHHTNQEEVSIQTEYEGIIEDDDESYQERNKARLRRKLVKRKSVERRERPKDFQPSCSVCEDEQMVTCERCNGFTIVVSPSVQTCPKCKGEGMHPCINCTPYRPPPKTSLYS